MITIAADKLVELARSILLAAEVPSQHADLVAKTLAAANLRGVDSHGIQLLPYYLERVKAGEINPRATGKVTTENGACLLYDGENGLGQVVADICTAHANRLAGVHGVGFVVTRNSNHFGACAFWAQRMSDEGNLGIVFSNTPPLVAPWQGKQVRLGTNPICMALPGPRKWLLDMATTTVAGWKIRAAALEGRQTIPQGWVMDAEGNPTTNTNEAINGLLMPLGGYKGYGLAMMVEILCGVLSGGAISIELPDADSRGSASGISQCFVAINVSHFMDQAEFERRISQLVEYMKSSPPGAGFDEVLVAGEPEWREEKLRSVNGICLSSQVWDALLAAADSVGVKLT
jgi:LDH2 family malate/lactate/ureidoglycolate dehydrogenase